jgi:hypothetical protein
VTQHRLRSASWRSPLHRSASRSRPSPLNSISRQGLFGVVWVWQQAYTFWEHVFAILQGLFWPALMIYVVFRAWPARTERGVPTPSKSDSAGAEIWTADGGVPRATGGSDRFECGAARAPGSWSTLARLVLSRDPTSGALPVSSSSRARDLPHRRACSTGSRRRSMGPRSTGRDIPPRRGRRGTLRTPTSPGGQRRSCACRRRCRECDGRLARSSSASSVFVVRLGVVMADSVSLES